MLTNRELVLSDSGAVEAVFDVSASQAASAAAALAYYRRVRFAHRELTDADSAVALSALNEVCDIADVLAAPAGHAVFRLRTPGVHMLSEAVCIYIADRDVPSYQPPEERERLAMLLTLSEPLRELTRDMREADLRVADERLQPVSS